MKFSGLSSNLSFLCPPLFCLFQPPMIFPQYCFRKLCLYLSSTLYELLSLTVLLPSFLSHFAFETLRPMGFLCYLGARLKFSPGLSIFFHLAETVGFALVTPDPGELSSGDIQPPLSWGSVLLALHLTLPL